MAAGGQKEPLSPSLESNLKRLQQHLGNPPDLTLRTFTLGTSGQTRVGVMTLSGMSDNAAVNLNILRPIAFETGTQRFDQAPPVVADLLIELLTVSTVMRADTVQAVVDRLLDGGTAVLVDGHREALTCETQGFQVRSISEPVTEGAVRGPREGFNEDLATNITLLRRRLQSASLRLHRMTVGTLSRTEVVVAYLEGIAKPEIVQEVHRRLERIHVDGILESGYLEEYLEDAPMSWFPQIEHSERPDKVAGALLEGRIAIMTNNTPFVLLVPTVFVNFLQASEDYYERSLYSSGLRLIRLMGLVLALLLPGLYVAVITIHQEMLPLQLALSIAGSREGNPFPAFVEALVMEVVFELLREAGVRLPRPVGPAVSIVGGLVVGESAVRAGIASPVMVVIVAVTGIANFAIPAFNLALPLRLLRFVMMILAAVAGIPGITLGVLALVAYMTSLRSFGVPYLTPLAPARYSEWKDVLIRAPWWAMKKRPKPFAVDRRRQKESEGNQ